MRFDHPARCALWLCALACWLVATTTGVRADALTDGRAELAAGRYRPALDSLQTALAAIDSGPQRSAILGEIGLAQFRLNHDAEAETALREALRIDANAGAAAKWQAMLAVLAAKRGDRAQAEALFAEAGRRAGGDPLLVVGIDLGRAPFVAPDQRLPLLHVIARKLQPLAPSPPRAGYLVQLAGQARRLGPAGFELTYAALREAKDTGPDEPRFRAEVQGELAQLYEDGGRLDDARHLNEGALTLAPADAGDLRVELEWRAARLAVARQDDTAALAAFQRAIAQVESIRADIPIAYHDGRSAFRTLFEPLYQQYADRLLRRSAGASTAAPALLREARQVVEYLKQSEFEEFLGGRCAVHPVPTATVDAIAADAAVLYPIILPDRLELLLSHRGEIRQFTRPVEGETVRATVRRFAGALRSAAPTAAAHAQTLHGWLIEPLEALLQQRQIRTLVVVPDGVLRLIPLAALHDGRAYLVERLAIVTSPGLSLITPEPIRPHANETLLAGMDEPGTVVERLPDAFLANLDVDGLRGRGQGARSRALRLRAADPALVRGAMEDRPRRDQLRDALRLPGVTEELNTLKTTVPGTVLLGAEFTAERFKRELLGAPYAIVHIASHGILGPTAAESFILAHDDVISLDQLESLLKADKFARRPVELLSLSACQTAEGDDRAPLGFSGIAVKTEVRSALGSLWPVDDAAASRLMVAFYRALAKPGTGRAAALQQAQQAVMKDKDLQHPYFWAPFILVGNWL